MLQCSNEQLNHITKLSNATQNQAIDGFKLLQHEKEKRKWQYFHLVVWSVKG